MLARRLELFRTRIAQALGHAAGHRLWRLFRPWFLRMQEFRTGAAELEILGPCLPVAAEHADMWFVHGIILPKAERDSEL